MNTPIMNNINKYINRNSVRMHMPGHKGNMNGIFNEISKYDLTEVTGTDSLYECDDCILECENEYAKIYGSKRSIISTCGSTLCIQTMLALIAKENGKIIVGRNIHISAVNAFSLLNLQPIWVYPSEKNGDYIPGEILSEDIEKAIIENPDAIAVYITTPDYFGVLSDVKSISEIAHKHNMPLLVDNAHGALLKFFPKSYHPMDLGADLCADSLHKTLPVFTGGAMLHINNEKYVDKAKQCMSLFGTTSPSYLIMESIDMTLDYIKNDVVNDCINLEKWVLDAKKIALENGFAIPSGRSDLSKLVLGFAPLGYDYNSFYEKLLEYNIEQEYMSETHCVFMPSPFNSQKDLDNVIALIKNIKPINNNKKINEDFLKSKKAMSIREAMFSPHITLKTEDCVGKISANVKSKCPPGIPLLIPGEIIDEKIVKILINSGIFQLDVVEC